MWHIVETTDPITRRDVADLETSPIFVDRGPESQLIIHFESEKTKQQFLDTPIHRSGDHTFNLDNPREDRGSDWN